MLTLAASSNSSLTDFTPSDTDLNTSVFPIVSPVFFAVWAALDADSATFDPIAPAFLTTSVFWASSQP